MIYINNLSKQFVTERGEVVNAIDRITLEVRPNEFLSIVGPSGCGKTTLLRIIAGLENASNGSISLGRSSLNKPNGKIGMVFQEYSLLPWRRIIDNVTLGLEFAGKQRRECLDIARHYLQLVGMESFSNAYPYELSGGMRQRVAIARALATDPEVLLMDEPFGALDAHTRILLQRELLRVWEKSRKTILFVTHSVDEAIYLSNRIIVMSARPGRIKNIINVDLPWPRDRGDPRYGKMSAAILEMLEEEVSSIHYENSRN